MTELIFLINSIMGIDIETLPEINTNEIQIVQDIDREQILKTTFKEGLKDIFIEEDLNFLFSN